MIPLKLRLTAKKIRTACEQFAFSDEAGLFTFHQDKSLNGMCAIGSYALKEKLSTVGIETNLIHGEFSVCGDHCWLEYDNKFIVDVTATQFNYWVYPKRVDAWGLFKPVSIIRIDNPYYIPKFGIKNDYRLFHDWPDSQRPHEGVIERVLELTA